jgi:ATP-dependent DNA ligase
MSESYKWRFPDAPSSEISRAGLAALPPGYMAQLKMDGWRCVIEFTPEGVTFTSRHRKPIPISNDLREKFTGANWRTGWPLPKHDSYLCTNIPPGTILDAEWCSRRPGNREESLTVFDVMQLGDEPLWGHLATDRFTVLKSWLPCEWIVPYMIPLTVIPLTGHIGYQGFFDIMQKLHPEAEGIVLKRLDSKYIGSYAKCADNPGWIKSRWRAGESGETVINKERRK